jgi:hypothetical protein
VGRRRGSLEALDVSARCRGCDAPLTTTFVDLGSSPPSNAYLRPEDLGGAERWYPLHAWVCDRCFLVQLEAYQEPLEIFGDYAYFSSYSDSWLAHVRSYAERMTGELNLDASSLVVELASNDGYLLQPFAQRGVGVLGVEPAANVAAVAVERGIPTVAEFFGVALAERLRAQGREPALVVGNNVLAHVPDLHDFVGGVAILIGERGLATFEFPHVQTLIERVEFDTIYHEHFSYFSLLALEPVFARHGLAIIDVDELPTHGGSLRVHVRRQGGTPSGRVAAVLARERSAGLDRIETYTAFAQAVAACKRAALTFLLDARAAGKRVVGYGAPAKGNTFLTYCGIRGDLVAFTVDRNPVKQGTYLPGSRIPVYAPDRIFAEKPDYVMILPWNIADEVMEQMSGIHAWGGRFVTAVPTTRIH